MKKLIFTLAIASSILLPSCGMQKFTVGDTSGETIANDKRKMVHLFYIVPIGRKQSFPVISDAKGYEVTTKHNVLDFIITGITVGLVDMKTVKFKAMK